MKMEVQTTYRIDQLDTQVIVWLDDKVITVYAEQDLEIGTEDGLRMLERMLDGIAAEVNNECCNCGK
jgi:hypothetical protein